MADSYENLVGSDYQVFLLLTSMCMCLITLVNGIVVYETSGQYVTSFGRRGLIEGVHSASRLVSMVSYMYVTISTTEF